MAKTKIAAGSATLAVKSDGTLWAWGMNNCGQLGLGTSDASPTEANPTPTQVGDASDWAAVACGSYHSLALKTDGTLWAWGWNDPGEIGLGDSKSPSVPTQVGTANDWAAVAGGGTAVSGYSLAIKKDGSLWAWGNSHWGQLGLGYSMESRDTPARVGAASDWAAVACGGAHTLALKSDGTLWAWGDSQYGQLGLGDQVSTGTPTQVGTANDWAAVACGYMHSLALKKDGSLWAWGWNKYGQLGLGDTAGRHSPTQVGAANDWTAVTGGADCSLALKSDGTLWAWGDGEYGQLGLADTRDRHSPTQVGTANDWASLACFGGLALKKDGSLWAWGDNSSGNLGLGDTKNRLVPTRVPRWPGSP